jgi:hypothetical protein
MRSLKKQKFRINNFYLNIFIFFIILFVIILVRIQFIHDEKCFLDKKILKDKIKNQKLFYKKYKENLLKDNLINNNNLLNEKYYFKINLIIESKSNLNSKFLTEFKNKLNNLNIELNTYTSNTFIELFNEYQYICNVNEIFLYIKDNTFLCKQSLLHFLSVYHWGMKYKHIWSIIKMSNDGFNGNF